MYKIGEFSLLNKVTIKTLRYYDEIGLFKNQSVLLQYSYKLRVLKGVLSLGLNVGFINQTFDKDEVEAVLMKNGYEDVAKAYILYRALLWYPLS